MSDLKELEQLVLAAKKNLPSNVVVIQCGSDGLWTILKDGNSDEDGRNLTFAQVVEKLHEWAKPKFVTVTIPVKDAEAFVREKWISHLANQIAFAISESIKRSE